MATALAEREPQTIAEPAEREIATEAAEHVRAYLEKHGETLAEVRIFDVGAPEAPPVTVPTVALRLLVDLLRELGRGRAVTVVPFGAELTTQQVADLLNVSRPYVVKLIEEGALPCRKVGPRRRIRFEDLMTYRHLDDAARREAARQLSEEADRLGI